MRHPRLLFILLIVAVALIAFMIGYENPKRFTVSNDSGLTGGAALDNLIRTIASRHEYGDRDNAAPSVTAVTRLSGGDLVQQCSDISFTAAQVLTEAGYRARVVAVLTAKTWNGCEDGHTLNEVWHPFYGGWVVVDFSLNRLYPQTIEAFTRGRAAFVPIDIAPTLHEAYVPPCAITFDADPEAWYDRIAQIALIYDNGAFYASADHPQAARAVEYGYPLTTDWKERFYG